MTDLHERLRILNRLEVPDLWSDIERREPRSRIPTARGGGRIAIVFVALAVSATAIWLAAVAFRSDTRPANPHPTPAVPGVRNGMIAYLGTVDDGGGQALFVINPNGTGRRRLSPGSMYSSRLSWSPDGRKIMFDRGIGKGEGEVVVMNADGSDPHVITSNPRAVYNGPIWSPDGTRIAFITGDSSLAIMDANGSNVHRVFDNPRECRPGNGLSWSPDSTRLVYVLECDLDTGAQSTSIEVINVDGTGRRTLVGPAEVIPLESAAGYSSPAWSPNGAQILFVDTQESASVLRSQIYVMNADGSSIRRVTKDETDDYSPVWSPDGTLIAFISDRGGAYQIWVMDVDGSDPRQVTREANAWNAAPAWQPVSPPSASFVPTGAFAFMGHEVGKQPLADDLYVITPGSAPRRLTSGDIGPSWSPNGQRVALVRGVSEFPVNEIVAVDVRSGREMVVTRFDAPADASWSPVGDRIAFSTQHGDIYSVRVDGSDRTQLTNPGGECSDGWPAWSPDGSMIAFFRDCEDEGDPGLYLVGSDGSGLRRISGDVARRPSWSPDGKTIAYARWAGEQDINDVYLLSLDTGKVRMLAPNAGSPAWSRDGRALAVVRSGHIVILDLNGQQIGTIDTPGLAVSSLDWSRSD